MSTPSEVPSSSKKQKSSAGRDSEGKRRKIASELPEDPPTAEAPKSQKLFKRLFSEEDEIKLLDAFLDISKIANISTSPPNTAALIFNKVGDSFRGQFSNRQLTDKLRKLRGKYARQINNEKTLKTSHDWKVFRLSQKIWGEDFAQPNDSGDSPAEYIQNEKKKVKTRSQAAPVENGEAQTAAHASQAENGGEAVTVPVAKLALENFSFLMQEVCCLPWDGVLREGLGSLEESVLRRLNEEWRLQQIAEAKVMAKRAYLVHEHAKLILDSVDTSRPD
ncbi:hypothetical protein NE237_009706 [Protea cynaroides]|uniref:Glabrous enhancer-binding protein-like DBD domain-containing protein n=1 Tax=Protea cynaroides TaxID=273540 RepID=A0A9Q0KYB3_9MAGN|nr:hypothetical protein NE237_009706 [Protea cynaroides]